MRRSLILLTLIAAASAILWRQSIKPVPIIATPKLTLVATAHQMGVVGYRDPVGAISPDGKSLAYSEGRFIHIVSSRPGLLSTLAPGEGQIRYLAWMDSDTVVADDPTPASRWWKYSLTAATRESLWPEKSLTSLLGRNVRQLIFRRGFAAGLATTNEGTELWMIAPDGAIRKIALKLGRASYPVFGVDGDDDVQYVIEGDRPSAAGGNTRQPMYGPMVILRAPGPYGLSGAVPTEVYYASPDQRGILQLWHRGHDVPARQLTDFARDAYAPSMSDNSTIVFKVQAYYTHLADVSADGGTIRQLTTFQSETPSYHPTQSLLAFTYGNWRRVVDDAKYPDIAQDIGVIDLSKPWPAAAPTSVIAKSESEDQALSWSPNGKWIAFHSHREMSDDVWLRPADNSMPPRRITSLGRGAEAGWPRWSPDGRLVLIASGKKGDGHSGIYTIGIDQEFGTETSPMKEIPLSESEGDITHAEWRGNDSVIALRKVGPGQHAIIALPLAGGAARVVQSYATEHDFSGLGVSPDGKDVAYVAPASDGYFQIFRKPIDGDGVATQVTIDPSNKTQPAWSPDGKRIAFTVWSYDATFYSFHAVP